MKSIPFVLDRAAASRNAQAEIATQWVWQEKSLIQWDADIAALKNAQLAELDARVSFQNNTEEWDVLLGQIEGNVRKILRLAKTHFRNDPVKSAMFEGFSPVRGGRDRIYNFGREVLEVWDNTDSAWNPYPGIDVGGLGSMLSNADGKKIINQRLRTTWRRKVLEMDVKAQILDEANVVWYSEATTRFPEGTWEGDLIRSTVPTTSDPVEPVGQAVISGIIADAGTIHFDVASEHATRFTILHRLPGTSQYVVLVADSLESSVTLDDQPPGEHLFKAFGTNSQGNGEESAPASVTVAAALAA